MNQKRVNEPITARVARLNDLLSGESSVVVEIAPLGAVRFLGVRGEAIAEFPGDVAGEVVGLVEHIVKDIALPF